MKDCIFCKIVSGEAPCYKVYEDNDVLAFLDIEQKDYGHTIVIPKAHFINSIDCEENVYAKVALIAKRLAKHYVEHCNFKGAVIFNLNNKEALQSVFHLHFHVVPKVDTTGNDNPKTPLEEQAKRLFMK